MLKLTCEILTVKKKQSISEYFKLAAKFHQIKAAETKSDQTNCSPLNLNFQNKSEGTGQQ